MAKEVTIELTVNERVQLHETGLWSGLAADADTSHESAKDWWESLGYSEDDCVHPVCGWDELADYEPTDDEQGCLEYGRQAKDDAEAIEAELEAAVAAYRAGDYQECRERLVAASHAELKYGDDPATRELAGALLTLGSDDLID